MNWRFFLAFPLAALLVGTPLHAPRLRPEIPPLEDDRCDYARAVGLYLRAHAYAAENPAVARSFLEAAEAERGRCRAGTPALDARITDLRGALFP